MAEDSRRVPMGPSENNEFLPSSEDIGGVDSREQTQIPEDLGVFDETKSTQSEKIPKKLEVLSLWNYLNAELRRGYSPEHDEKRYDQKRERVYTFIRIPKELEKTMLYGFFICMDAFLYIFTFLPLRVVIALFRLITIPFSTKRVLQPAEISDLLKAVVLLVCSYVLGTLDISMLYHIVRGQAVIKLYIMYNMLDVADKLFSSFGQDILDSLLWTASKGKSRKRENLGTIPHLFLAIIYVFLHAMLVLIQATTLNVAFNSHNKALLTIMMSNNFVELKGSVFKKFDKYNLFQMTCSDVRERYHYMVLFMFVFLRNMNEFSWSRDHFWELLPDMGMVLFAEVVVDSTKHAFITKFNLLSAEVYSEYRASLAYDMIVSRKQNAFSDHSDLVSRRMGFIPLPLGCLVYRIVRQTVCIDGSVAVVLFVLSFLCLVAFKVLVSIVLLVVASRLVKDCGLMEEIIKDSSTKEKSPKHKHDREISKSTSNIEEEERQSQDITNLRKINSQTLLSSESTFCVGVLAGDLEVGSVFKRNSHAKTPKETKSEGNARPLSDIERYTLCNRIV
ncbi:putative transmembrane anterior posterior transformation protein 1-like isoform X1 [Apostichopus japonicus]|uniref:Putative transmembrane anterior posterior transformation protein 1-like isoform X1 n=1 Tax=Stichopus japonicus TaxID=307972 RepID=A0A2G8KN22_STIJA|nr:putative transmembrane anterior posterior transformation protein 1-like isoform X1 [Apostichopus japonicus]